MPLREYRQGAHHVGLALACDQVRDRDERGRAVASRKRRRGQIGAEVYDTRLTGPLRLGQLGDALAVGEHEVGGAQAAGDGGLSAGAARSGVEDIAAVHRHDQGNFGLACDAQGDARGVPRGHRIVRVHHVKRKGAAHAPQGGCQARPRPRAPACVRAAARRRDIGQVGHRQAIADLVARLTRTRPQLDERARRAAPHGRPRRHQTVQDEHAHIGAGVPGGARLAMRPDSEHRVSAAGVELGDDGDLHQRRWVASVRCASVALR